jgi:O-antigen ligase
MRANLIKSADMAVYWSIVLLPFSIAIAPGVSSSFIGLLFFGFFLKKALKQERFFAKTAIDLPFFAFLVISLISISNSHDYVSSVRGVFKFVQNALIFLIFAEELRDRVHLKRIVFAMLAGAALASFDAVWQIISGKDFIRGHSLIVNIGLPRATAAFPNANGLGVYLVPIAPLAFGLALYFYKNKARIGMGLAAGLIATGIILTLSRFAGIAFYLSLLLMSMVKKDKVVVTCLVALLVLSPLLIPRNIKNWARLVRYNPVVFLFNGDRISIYRNSVNMIAHHPFIGVGYNTFSKRYLEYKLPEPADATTSSTIYAHNNFLQIAGETGLLGLAAFFWILYNLFAYCIRLYRNVSDAYLKTVALGLSAGLFAFLVNGLAETSLYYSRVAIIFWYCAGFILALKKFADSSKLNLHGST